MTRSPATHHAGAQHTDDPILARISAFSDGVFAFAIVAAVFYGASATVGGLVYNLLWWYGAYAAKLTSPALSARERRAHTIAWGPAPLVVAALTAIAFVRPPLAVAGYVATVFVYILPVPRLVALKRSREYPRGSL